MQRPDIASSITPETSGKGNSKKSERNLKKSDKFDVTQDAYQDAHQLGPEGRRI